jgi:hypothetical protein
MVQTVEEWLIRQSKESYEECKKRHQIERREIKKAIRSTGVYDCSVKRGIVEHSEVQFWHRDVSRWPDYDDKDKVREYRAEVNALISTVIPVRGMTWMDASDDRHWTPGEVIDCQPLAFWEAGYEAWQLRNIPEADLPLWINHEVKYEENKNIIAERLKNGGAQA